MGRKTAKSIGLFGLLVAALVFITVLIRVSYVKWLYRPKKPPNIILISIDALRADHLSCYGYSRKTSAHNDALAQEGVMFSNAVSHSPKTTPSHMSMITSLHHEIHQVHQVTKWGPGEGTMRLNDSVPTLAEILKKQGYATVAFTGGANVHASLGFDKGFDKYTHETAMDMYAHETVMDKIISWINSNYRENFFLFFHTYVVHDPYLPPPPYNRMYDPDYSGDIIDSREKLMSEREIDKEGNARQENYSLADDSRRWWSAHKAFWESVDKESSRDVDFLKALYDGAIYCMDERMIGVLIQKLKELNIYENTLIVFTSDHGEAFNEHQNFLHDDLFWETLHVPLILVYPGVIPENIKVEQLVRLTDIMPTIFDIMGTKTDIFMQGVSLLPAIKGEDLDLSCYSSHTNMKSIRTDEYAYIKWVEYEYPSDVPQEQTDKYTYIDIIKHEFLYDRLRDSTENYNIGADRLQMLAEQEKEIYEQSQDCQALAERYAPTEKVFPEPETLEKLKSLGYL